MPEWDEATLGGALREIEAPASIPDIPKLVAAGRRRDRWRRAAAAGGVFVAVAAVTAATVLAVGGRHAAPAVPPGRLSVCVSGPQTPLPAPVAEIYRVDPTGRFAVGSMSNQIGGVPLALQAVVWDNGVAHDVDPVAGPGQVELSLTDVNASGWVVGAMERWVGDNLQVSPIQYRDGRISLLPLPGGVTQGDAAAINARGDIVGTGQRDGAGIPLLWPAGAPGTVTILPMPDGHRSVVASTITDAGAIGGRLSGAGGSYPYYWASPSSPGVQLSRPERATDAQIVQVRGDYAVGWVAYQPGDPVPSHPFAAEWDLRTGTVRVAEDLPDASVVAMDAAGAYVAVVSLARDRYATATYVVQPGRPNIVVPAPAGTTGLSPRIIAMSNDGHLLTGQLYDESRVSVSGLMTWTCS